WPAFQLVEQPSRDGQEELGRGSRINAGYLSPPAEHAGPGSVKAYIRNHRKQETPLVATIDILGIYRKWFIMSIKRLSNGQYRVLSSKGRNMGTYDTKHEAHVRLG